MARLSQELQDAGLDVGEIAGLRFIRTEVVASTVPTPTEEPSELVEAESTGDIMPIVIVSVGAAFLVLSCLGLIACVLYRGSKAKYAEMIEEGAFKTEVVENRATNYAELDESSEGPSQVSRETPVALEAVSLEVPQLRDEAAHAAAPPEAPEAE